MINETATLSETPDLRKTEGLDWRVSDDLVDYEAGRAFMEERVAGIVEGVAPETVWLLEHPPLYTAGTSADPSELVDQEKFPVFDAGRGGRYTYHGPGQRIAYVMLDLRSRGRDVRAHVHNLEAWVIAALDQFNVKGERREGRIGIWVDRGNGREDKIGAIGVRVRHWVTFHGISLNVEPDLSHYEGIIPCGISDQGVTSLVDLGLPVSMADVDVVLQETWGEIFGPKL
jgi:lipoyl(octanoyl) transferase